MNPLRTKEADRLRQLVRVCDKELAGLMRVMARLFAVPLTAELLASLDENEDLSERLDAFSARFGRLQDALTDKLLPAYFSLVSEPPRPVVEMLDRAERLGLIASTDAFLEARKLRNRLVHEYVEDKNELAANLGAARDFVPQLQSALANVAQALARLPQGPST
ncbi:MAG: hypothetical protein ACK58C_06205 [Betaproteobacteria bacterium]